ncbi:IclR family transcriptional regulator [Enterovirga rhinocerotis]|uniref:IclR family transcriptional regulator n=1 Tax=Enterovirga rhinocerotis TaxID=1339210 RepID=A0A4R7BTU8_9HYPH|nr:helix-turn-helix domain-containing protein [Enterovirga rhinocerotis]TDR89184.1 IclR family transcriptional regulator [Enterovirga rhinocerotis]
MSSLDKMLGILGLFREERAGITLDDVMALTQTSRATAYRYLQSLTEAGLLAPATGGTYRIGARIVELDRLLRLTDPLLGEAQRPMRELSAELHANMLLCSYYGDTVMCVDLVWPDRTIEQAYERGRPMPMFRGAMAKTILAHLSPYHLRNIQNWHAAEIAAAGLGESWDEFRATMAGLRRAGIVVTRAEVVPGLVGLGAALLDAEHRILGSLVLAIPEQRYDEAGEGAFVNRLGETAARINAAIACAAAHAGGPPPKPPRPRRSRRPAPVDDFHIS